VKCDENSFLLLPGASGFTNPPPTFHNRSHRPGTFANPYKTHPKLVNPGFGSGRNPSGGVEDTEFDEKSLVSKKEESEKSKTSDYFLNNKKKKKKSAE
jgi:hypothetical protein